jgi:hypothetical protein
MPNQNNMEIIQPEQTNNVEVNSTKLKKDFNNLANEFQKREMYNHELAMRLSSKLPELIQSSDSGSGSIPIDEQNNSRLHQLIEEGQAPERDGILKIYGLKQTEGVEPKLQWDYEQMKDKGHEDEFNKGKFQNRLAKQAKNFREELNSASPYTEMKP